MPSLEPRRRSRARFEESGDQTSESDLPKRQKRTTNGHLSEEDEEDQDDQYDRRVSHSNRIKSSPSRENDIGEFQTGAILRVLVENFVTYEHAEFNPGPNLNMVIGPNGTGKSSLVCAICLGLGFPPSYLGRAKDVGEFVKYGKDNAIVEIELQGRPEDRENYVIRVLIRKEDNRTRWWLNGRDSTRSAIKDTVRSLRIQIDNLCQFLPQDKVAEFAGLTPVDLLGKTLHAAAPEDMTEKHEKLKTLYTKHKEEKKKLDSCVENLTGFQTRQQGSQADVDRLREREALQEKIDTLESTHVVALYIVKQQEHTDAKKRRKEAELRLKKLEEACGPALQAVNEKRDYQQKIKAVIRERKNALKEAEAMCSQFISDIESKDEDIKTCQNEQSAENDSLNTRKRNILQIRNKIKEFELQLKKPPREFNGQEYNINIRQQETIVRENLTERRTLAEERAELKEQFSAHKYECEQLEKDLEKLDSQEGQRFFQLRQTNADAARGWEWLQEHRDEFEKEVYGPPLLSCSITDQQYSDQIQSLLTQEDFLCFTCQTPNDHKKLSNCFYKQLGISVSIRTCGTPFTSFRPGIHKEQIREMGLDAYAIEYLEGPEPVLAMLCAEKKLHLSGVALRDISNDQFDQISNCERIPSWSSGRILYRVSRRREYGGNAVSTSTRKIMPGRFWTNQPVDQSERTSLQNRIDKAKESMEKLREKGKGILESISKLDEADAAAEEKRSILVNEKNELQEADMIYKTLGDKIAMQQSELQKVQNNIAESKVKMLENSEKEDRLVIKKAKSVLEHQEQLSQIRDAHQALLEIQIRLIEADSDVEGLVQQNTSIQQQLDEKKIEIGSIAQEVNKLRKAASETMVNITKLAEAGKDIDVLRSQAENRTPEDIHDEIEGERARLLMISNVDPSIMREYERRARRIAELTAEKEARNDKLNKYLNDIKNVKEQWEPRVDEVISQINEAFSYNFEQINCAGEVSIHKDEDFDEWAIVIKVKFRENETLQQLNQHRQSGGERAVSTIFYLMALQSMAQAPFRVVDEINQGMDPRNERMVHERMVEIACREHTSQYFLITPKLLTGLRYDERMRILCIASGEHMPAPTTNANGTGALDFANLVSIQRAITSAA